jgi:hypothetical protein
VIFRIRPGENAEAVRGFDNQPFTREKGEVMAHDVEGPWELVQSNGFGVQVDIVQSHDPSGRLADGPFHGSAKVVSSGAEANLNGELRGDSFEFGVDWPNGTRGKYTGSFDAGGNLSGVTFDLAHPTSQATWFRQ